jgi:hypothetical protein
MNGISTDQVFQPLADFGLPNPLFYHVFADDMDADIGVTSAYTVTAAGNGAAAIYDGNGTTAGDGAWATLTTNSSTPLATDSVIIQPPSGSFRYVAGKKMFFLVRLSCSDMTNSAITVGLTSAASGWASSAGFLPSAGVFINKASGANNNLLVQANVSSTSRGSATIPTTAYTLADAATVSTNPIELGFYITRLGEVRAFVGSQLTGQIPQSGTGSVNSAGVSILPSLGAVAAVTPTSISTNCLYPTIGIQSGTTSSKVLGIDFILCAKER